ncbi:MAG: GNAT family N-acetyltransferase [Akkermansiaceae bacterium]|nr:GNAT family N-acetyltransferase [Akkermansiaceae bacterium]
MASAVTIRRATGADIPQLADFNRGIARETEGYDLKPEVITAGITRIMEQPELGFYLLAEIDGAVAGSLLITTEWSDWRNGVFWWIQSVYVRADFRRRGIYRSLHTHVEQLAESEPDVCGFRLYVEHGNRVAQATYQSLGMGETPYRVYEALKPGIEFADPV